MSIVSAIRKPLGAVLMIVITLVLAGITAVAAASGQLTAAAVSGAGLVVVVIILGMVALSTGK